MNASLVLRARTVVANGEHEPLDGANEVARERSGERVDKGRRPIAVEEDLSVHADLVDSRRNRQVHLWIS